MAVYMFNITVTIIIIVIVIISSAIITITNPTLTSNHLQYSIKTARDSNQKPSYKEKNPEDPFGNIEKIRKCWICLPNRQEMIAHDLGISLTNSTKAFDWPTQTSTPTHWG